MRERRNPLTATNSFEDEKRENVFAITVNDPLHGRYAVVSSQLVRVWLTFTLPHSFSILLERPEDYVLHVLFADGGFLGGTLGRFGNCAQGSRGPVRRACRMKNMS